MIRGPRCIADQQGEALRIQWVGTGFASRGRLLQKAGSSMARLDQELAGRHTIPAAISRGFVWNGSLVADYNTSEPSPGKWVAIGTVMFWSARRNDGFPRWMLVGSGRSEQQAVAHLRARMVDANPPRWKIKCDPTMSPNVMVDEIKSEEMITRYVVPWEIEIDAAAEAIVVEANEIATF